MTSKRERERNREKERDRDRARDREKEIEWERDNILVTVEICLSHICFMRERERKKEPKERVGKYSGCNVDMFIPYLYI